MALAASPFDQPQERQPGQFQRTTTGTPYVAHPSETIKDGSRPKRVAYGRPSSFGKQIENTYNLMKWAERRLMLGIGVDYSAACAAMAAPELAAACSELVALDPESDEFRNAADAIVVEAKRLAKAGLAAERGTHGHALAEEDDEGRDWVALAENGEVLGLDRGVQAALVAEWRTMLERDGLEILATEFAMVHDGYRMAGTGDRIARLTKPLRFTLASGEIVELLAGTVVVLDIKTGKLRRGAHDVPMYWQSYAVQVATYAGGVLYDPDTDTRTPYPWDVDQHWALIAHLDVLGALGGAPSCELVLVDIDAGRTAADLCIAAKAWEKRSDVFSVAMISETEAVVGTATPVVSDEQPTAVAIDSATAAAPTCPCQVGCDPREGQDFDWRCEQRPCPPVATPAPTQQEIVARLRRHPDIDEGVVADPEALDRTFARMAELFMELDVAAKSWMGNLQGDAMRAGCGFHAKERHTLRRFEIIRGLVALSVAQLDDDDLIRHLVEHATGDDVAQFPTVKPGHVLGAMDASEATRFALACDRLAADQIALTFTDAGRPLFIERAAA